jgi:signal transduction histidine kinase
MWQYSSVIALFLLVFIVILYSSVSKSVAGKETSLVKTAASNQAKLLAAALKDQKLSDDELRQLRAERRVNGLFFYYIADQSGKLIFREDPYQQKQTKILSAIKGWKPDDQEYKTVKLKLNFSDDAFANHPIEKDEAGEIKEHEHEEMISPDAFRTDNAHSTYSLRIVAQPVYNLETFEGVVYIGQDITDSNRVLNQLLWVVLVFGGAFLLVVFPLSYVLSRRAMRPIKTSYERQRAFVADASHELRTPLSVLYASLDVLEEEEMAKMGPFSQRVVADMRDELRRMTKMVGDLLELARVDSGQPMIEKGPYDVAAGMRQVVRNLQAVAQPKGVEIALYAPDTLNLQADGGRVEQVMYILIENALKHAPSSSTIHVEVEAEHEMRLPLVRLRVRDDGPGIAAEHVPHLFDRFYRVDSARAKAMGGSGLGLAIAKWIVDAHGGTIRVDSEVAVGTTFTVELPLN